ALSEFDPGVRRSALEALGRLGTDAAPALPSIRSVVLDEPDDRVHRTALEIYMSLDQAIASDLEAIRRSPFYDEVLNDFLDALVSSGSVAIPADDVLIRLTLHKWRNSHLAEKAVLQQHTLEVHDWRKRLDKTTTADPQARAYAARVLYQLEPEQIVL